MLANSEEVEGHSTLGFVYITSTGKQSGPISPKISANNFAGILRTVSQNLVVSLVFAQERGYPICGTSI